MEEVINIIKKYIKENNSKEITAEILQQVLIKIIQQPNQLIGNTDELVTENKILVSSINEIRNSIPSDVIVAEDRLKKIEEKLAIFQLNGAIIPYAGPVDKIPKGWQLCDGTNGTLDLRGLFVVGYDPRNPDYDKIGNTGGADKVTLTIDEMPKHAPEGVTDATGGHIHDFIYTEWVAGGGIAFAQGGNGQYKLSKTSVDGEHVHKVKTNAIGNDKAHENRPPYFVLAWIIFTGANSVSSLLPAKSTSLEAAQILKHVDFDLISADLMHHDAVVEVSGVKHKVFYSKATLEDLKRELTSSITEPYLDLKMYYWGISGENQKLDQVKVGFLTDDNRFFDFASPLKKVKDIVKDTTEAQIYKYTDCYLHMQNSLEDSQYFMMMFLNEFGELYSKNCPSISISDATSLQIVAIYPDDAPVFEYQDPTNFRVNFTGKRYLFLQ